MSVMQHFFRWFCWIMDYSFLNIHNVWLILFILGCFSGVIFIFVFLICKKKRYICWILSVLMIMNVGGVEHICRNLPQYVPRLENILANAEFVLAGNSSQDKFLAALGLKKEYGKNIQEIVYYMGEKDWKGVEHSCGNMNLYFQNIHHSIKNTIFLTDIHAGVPVRFQINIFVLFLWALCGISIGILSTPLCQKRGDKRIRLSIILTVLPFLLFLSAGVMIYIVSTVFSFSVCATYGTRKLRK